MTDCEFKKECSMKFCPTLDDCFLRKFAIIVRNQTIEKSKKIMEWVGEVAHPLDAVMQALDKLESLKIKESP